MDASTSPLQRAQGALLLMIAAASAYRSTGELPVASEIAENLPDSYSDNVT